ncbi:hypothetical protein [Acidobacterium sp. S8]|uniref:hypothetical protein n=1 Tax=Acidobacterium sp. S8 TaxID=1641854 RepID=UPI00131E534B|nr:hypothetical protein [Acidobacterium sp. S8]
MARILTIAVALLCVICVLALCIAPSVDIPQTVLKSLQVIALLIFSLVAGTLLLADLVRLAFLVRSLEDNRVVASILGPLLPLEISCVQQC